MVSLALLLPLTAAPVPAQTSGPAVAGGSAVTQRQWNTHYRWVVALMSPDAGRAFCTGSLIARDWVLTAAHCVHNRAPDDIVVAVNSRRLRTAERIAVAGIHQHESHRQTGAINENDVALLRLASPAPDDITPVALASRAADETLTADRSRAYAAGWGRTDQNDPGSLSAALRHTRSTLRTRRFCQRQYDSEGLTIAGSMLCAGVWHDLGAVCNGDSGGPLVSRTDAGPVLIGTVMGGSDCGSTPPPAIFSRVSRFVDWIAARQGDTYVLNETFNDGELNIVPWTFRSGRDLTGWCCATEVPRRDGDTGDDGVGFLRLEAGVTDNVAVADLDPPQPLTNPRLVARLRHHPANQYYLPAIVLDLIDRNGDPMRLWVSLRRSTYGPDYDNQPENYDRPQITLAGPQGRIMRTYASEASSNAFDIWVVLRAVITSDNGRLSVGVAGPDGWDVNFRHDSLVGARLERVTFSGYGWWTGHYLDIDWVELSGSTQE
ncbi:MAG: serine protease [Rhodobacter sp.]|nr:serine protease [Paracoccaceae bacterium]MCC0076210.1 serine protease [Rhodobacter sp.]